MLIKKLFSRFFLFFSFFLSLLTLLVWRSSSISVLPTFAQSSTILSSPFDFGNRTVELNHEILHFTQGFYRSPDGRHVAYLTDRSVNSSLTRAAAILIDNPAGSGIFFYVMGAARVDGEEKYSPPVFLGDRIKITAIRVSGKTVTIDYLTHAANEPLGIPPTRPATATHTIQDNGNLS